MDATASSFCSACGSPLAPGAKFCTSCGVRVTEAGGADAPAATDGPGVGGDAAISDVAENDTQQWSATGESPTTVVAPTGDGSETRVQASALPAEGAAAAAAAGATAVGAGGGGTGRAGEGGSSGSGANGGGGNRTKSIAIFLAVLAVLALLALLATWAFGGAGTSGGGSSPSPRPTPSSASPTPSPMPSSTTASPTPTQTVTATATATVTATTTPVPPPGPLGCTFPQQSDILGPSDLLCNYFYSINTQNWQAACAINWAVPCAQLQQAAGTTWSNVTIQPLLGGDPNNPVLEVTAQTNQPPSQGPNGQACTLWNLRYQMGSEQVMIGTVYFITGVTGTNSGC